MDKAPAYGAGDCRFESCLSQFFFLDLKLIRVILITDAEQLICDRVGPDQTILVEFWYDLWIF